MWLLPWRLAAGSAAVALSSSVEWWLRQTDSGVECCGVKKLEGRLKKPEKDIE